MTQPDERELVIRIKQVWIENQFSTWDGEVHFDGEEVFGVTTPDSAGAINEAIGYIYESDSVVPKKWRSTRAE